jgi:monoamine oxidase
MDLTIIIGAGAAGLQTARRLSAAGYAVIILEASPIAGGRILTLSPGESGGFSVPVEGGAEFIHGQLPISLQLARESGVPLQPVSGEMVRMRQGKQPNKDRAMSKDWGKLMRRMGMLDADRPLADFLSETFPGDRYRDLRDSVGRMAEGYDLADLHRVSTRSLYREWAEEADEEEYRPEGGYGRLIGYLTDICRNQGCRFHFSTRITAVRWQCGSVEVTASDGQVFVGRRLITTVSLGVLKTGVIRWSPELPLQQQAIGRLGFGSVMKVLMEFREPFWGDRKKSGASLFILSDEQAPTWWTQTGDDCPLLTGWIAGGPMQVFRGLNSDERIDTCLRSLANLFSRDIVGLRKELAASMFLDWETAPFIRGGYSFETVGGAADRATLCGPIGETLYFAGEAVYEGAAPGTVEAAFSSGNTVAEKIAGQTY